MINKILNGEYLVDTCAKKKKRKKYKSGDLSRNLKYILSYNFSLIKSIPYICEKIFVFTTPESYCIRLKLN